jgi:Chromo (CHRromatin Organisation MOdifier) domain
MDLVRLERVRGALTNAYELDLPKHWRIHPVISIEHLEPAPNEPDPYDRPINDGSDVEPITQEGDTEEWQSWEIEKLVDNRICKYGKGKPEVEYLVRWKGYGPAFDEWYSIKLLGSGEWRVRRKVSTDSFVL